MHLNKGNNLKTNLNKLNLYLNKKCNIFSSLEIALRIETGYMKGNSPGNQDENEM